MAEQQFPWIFYHPTEGSRIFENAEELKAAGPGWVLTPGEAADAAARSGSRPTPSPPPEDEGSAPRSRR